MNNHNSSLYVRSYLKKREIHSNQCIPVPIYCQCCQQPNELFYIDFGWVCASCIFQCPTCLKIGSVYYRNKEPYCGMRLKEDSDPYVLMYFECWYCSQGFRLQSYDIIMAFMWARAIHTLNDPF